MKALQDFKDFTKDFIQFFRKEFFQDSYRNEFLTLPKQEKFFAKYIRSKKSKNRKL